MLMMTWNHMTHCTYNDHLCKDSNKMCTKLVIFAVFLHDSDCGACSHDRWSTRMAIWAKKWVAVCALALVFRFSWFVTTVHKQDGGYPNFSYGCEFLLNLKNAGNGDIYFSDIALPTAVSKSSTWQIKHSLTMTAQGIRRRSAGGGRWMLSRGWRGW